MAVRRNTGSVPVAMMSILVGVNDSGYVVGQDHHRAKFTDHEVDLMIQLCAEGFTYKQVAEKFGCCYTTVGDYVRCARRAQLAVGQRRVKRAVKG
jgi:DNA-binding NarL/FixJ family response regulator